MNWVSCGGKQLQAVDFGLTLADILPDESRREKPDLPDNPKQIVIPHIQGKRRDQSLAPNILPPLLWTAQDIGHFTKPAYWFAYGLLSFDTYEVMNSAEQTITWLITLGVLESPKKTLSDPEGFLQASLRDGVVLCKLLERLRPGSVHTVSCWSISSFSSIIECINDTKALVFLWIGNRTFVFVSARR